MSEARGALLLILCALALPRAGGAQSAQLRCEDPPLRVPFYPATEVGIVGFFGQSGRGGLSALGRLDIGIGRSNRELRLGAVAGWHVTYGEVTTRDTIFYAELEKFTLLPKDPLVIRRIVDKSRRGDWGLPGIVGGVASLAYGGREDGFNVLSAHYMRRLGDDVQHMVGMSMGGEVSHERFSFSASYTFHGPGFFDRPGVFFGLTWGHGFKSFGRPSRPLPDPPPLRRPSSFDGHLTAQATNAALGVLCQGDPLQTLAGVGQILEDREQIRFPEQLLSRLESDPSLTRLGTVLAPLVPDTSDVLVERRAAEALMTGLWRSLTVVWEYNQAPPVRGLMAELDDRVIRVGDTRTGVLNTADPLYTRERRGQFWSLTGIEGESVTIDLSASFDTYLYVTREIPEPGDDPEPEWENDDGGVGLNSRISIRFPADGVYTIVVSSFESGVTGPFTLRVSGP